MSVQVKRYQIAYLAAGEFEELDYAQLIGENKEQAIIAFEWIYGFDHDIQEVKRMVKVRGKLVPYKSRREREKAKRPLGRSGSWGWNWSFGF